MNQPNYLRPGYPAPGQAYPAPGPQPMAGQPAWQPGAPYPGPYPQRRKGGTLKVVLIIVGSLVLAFGALIGVSLLLATSVDERALTATEREQVFTVDDLADWMPDYKINRAFEKTSYVKTLDGSRELVYDYEHAEELYVTCTITVGQNKSDAVGAYTGYKIGERFATMAGDGISIESRNDLYKAGDESEFGIVKGAAGPLGNQLVARKGNRVVYIMFSGVYFTEASDLKELLDGPVNRALNGK